MLDLFPQTIDDPIYIRYVEYAKNEVLSHWNSSNDTFHSTFIPGFDLNYK